MLGSISSFETLTSVDGPGIRIIVFMSGCKKKCLYCHNPETWKMEKPKTTVSELVSKILRYQNYFNYGGGVTFSGGEPLLQTDFLISVCKELKKNNINIVIDTAGDYNGDLRELLKFVDLVILDIKHIWDNEYYSLTKTKLDNFDRFINILNKSMVPVSIRQVIVPGIHDNLEYLKDLKEYLKKITSINDITFIPYHKHGEDKYEKLGLSYPLKDLNAMDIDECERLYKEFLKL